MTFETEGITSSPHRLLSQTSTEWMHRRIEYGQTRRYWKTSERTPVQSTQPRRHEIVWWKAGPMAWGRLETCSQGSQAAAPRRQGDNSPRRPPLRPVAGDLQTNCGYDQTNFRLVACWKAGPRAWRRLETCS